MNIEHLRKNVGECYAIGILTADERDSVELIMSEFVIQPIPEILFHTLHGEVLMPSIAVALIHNDSDEYYTRNHRSLDTIRYS